MLIDTHTHLNFQTFDNDRDQIISHAIESGVAKMIVVGTNLDSSTKAVEMAKNHSALFASVGIHPHHAKQYLKLHSNQRKKKIRQDLDIIQELASHPKVVAIGEVGLDRHKYKSATYQPVQSKQEWKDIFDIQKYLLIQQVHIAQKKSLPLILHSRQLKDQVLQTILSAKTQPSLTGVFHCFEGSKKYAKAVIQAGFHISFTGNITYIFDRESVVKSVPLDKLLIETDSPYMSPKPVENQRNQPANSIHIASYHSSLRQVPLSRVIDQTTQNALHLFPRLEI